MSRRLLALGCAAVVLSPAAAHAATWSVSDTTDTPVGQACPSFTGCSLREAVTSTENNPGADAILVSGGGTTYPLTNGELTVTQDLTVSRVGAGAATVNGGGLSRIFNASGSGTDLDVKFMTLTNGADGGGNGGAILMGSGTTLTVESSTISNSSGLAGGGIYSQGSVSVVTASGSLTGSTITGNTATFGSGGAIAVSSTGTLSVGARSTITGNNADGFVGAASGGGLYSNGADVTINQATISGNSVVGTSAYGGGVALAGTGASLSVTRSTISGNEVLVGADSSATNGGGAVGVDPSATADVTTTLSTLTGNSVAFNGSTTGSFVLGGAIYNDGGGTTTVTSSTVANNAATASGSSSAAAGAFEVSDLTISGSIAAENTQPGSSQCAGSLVTTGGYNVLGDMSGCTFTADATDSTGVTDAGLDTLANYGGLTNTLRLVIGSDAIDKIPAANALCTTETTDQRGTARPQSTNCDAGAFEARPATLTITPDPRSFTTVPLSGSSNANVAVSNGGDLAMSAAPSPAVSAPFSYVSGCTSAVAPGSNCLMTLKFDPSAGGSYSRTLTVTAGSLSDTATLTGIGWASLQAPAIKRNGAPATGVKLGLYRGNWPTTPSGYTLRWIRCDADGVSNCGSIGGASHSTYTPSSADVGHTLRVGVTATTSGIDSDEEVTAATGVVTQTPPSLVEAPVIKRAASPQVGVKLGAYHGRWTESPTSYAAQWIRCDADGVSNCTSIGGAAHSTYVPTGLDIGRTLRVRVTASNAGGPGSPATSAPSGVVSP